MGHIFPSKLTAFDNAPAAIVAELGNDVIGVQFLRTRCANPRLDMLCYDMVKKIIFINKRCPKFLKHYYSDVLFELSTTEYQEMIDAYVLFVISNSLYYDPSRGLPPDSKYYNNKKFYTADDDEDEFSTVDDVPKARLERSNTNNINLKKSRFRSAKNITVSIDESETPSSQKTKKIITKSKTMLSKIEKLKQKDALDLVKQKKREQEDIEKQRRKELEDLKKKLEKESKQAELFKKQLKETEEKFKLQEKDRVLQVKELQRKNEEVTKSRKTDLKKSSENKIIEREPDYKKLKVNNNEVNTKEEENNSDILSSPGLKKCIQEYRRLKKIENESKGKSSNINNYSNSIHNVDSGKIESKCRNVSVRENNDNSLITTGHNIKGGEFNFNCSDYDNFKIFQNYYINKNKFDSFNNNSRNNSDVHAAFDMFNKNCDVKKESTSGLYKMLLFHEMCSKD
jgi:hypothetical protein